jgi:predicted Zn-dependent peptidase
VIALDAGSRVERAIESGIGHLLEHLALRGGHRYRGAREVGLAVQRLGGNLNGFITHDLVAYHVTVRAEYALEALDLLLDIVGSPRLDAAELAVERDVVADEIAGRRDHAGVLADDLLDRALFGDHPLGRATVGSPEVVARLGADDLRAFHEHRYTTSSAVVVVAGDATVSPRAEQVAERLAQLPAAFPAEPSAPAPPPRTSHQHERREGRRAQLRLGYRLEADLSSIRARAAFTVLAGVLGGPIASRLAEDLRERRGLCYDVSARPRVLSDAAVLGISAEVAAPKAKDVLALLREHVERLRRDGAAEEEVEIVRRHTAGTRVLALEHSRAVAQYAARQTIVFGQVSNAEDAVRAADAVTPDDVADLVRSISGAVASVSVGPGDTDGSG